METTENKSKQRNFAIGLAIGIPIGMPVGIAIGNLVLGPAIGLLIGVVLGLTLNSTEMNENEAEKEFLFLNTKSLVYLLILGIVLFLELLIYWFTQNSAVIS